MNSVGWIVLMNIKRYDCGERPNRCAKRRKGSILSGEGYDPYTHRTPNVDGVGRNAYVRKPIRFIRYYNAYRSKRRVFVAARNGPVMALEPSEPSASPFSSKGTHDTSAASSKSLSQSLGVTDGSLKNETVELVPMSDEGRLFGWSTSWVAGTFVLVYLFIGTVFYSVAESWSPVDALYFVVQAGLNVGYGDIQPTREISRLFTAGFVLLGNLLLGGALAIFVQQALVKQERMIEQQAQEWSKTSSKTGNPGGESRRMTRRSARDDEENGP